MAEGACIAIVGAESTGKTTLAAALAAALVACGRRVAWVPEGLRDWCVQAGRTPAAHEQAGILEEQHQRIAQAAAAHELVLCDTTALMTAVYSRIVFGDRSLDERALVLHRRMRVTLLMACDLPWVSDGLQREGPQVREPVDDALRELLARGGIGFSVVHGSGPQRLAQALATLAPLLAAAPAGGLFTGLGSAPGGPARWACECCDGDSERALRRRV